MYIAFQCPMCMTNTIALNLGGQFSATLEQARQPWLPIAVSKKRVSHVFRTIVAVALFVLAGFISVGSSLDLVFAKNVARRVASKMREVKSKGQFRLLNIYKTLSASNPSLIQAMNHATTGLASWYGGIFHGRKTAMGTTYNMYAMTAAHRSLPLGTWVKVTNERNGKSIVVQVTDRGPYVANRIMDLSYAAAQKLGYANAGTTNISMKVIGQNYASASEAEQAADPMAANASSIAEVAAPTSNTSTVPITPVSLDNTFHPARIVHEASMGDAFGNLSSLLTKAITAIRR
jgi:rare lipoprotein A (peptidoglycan hydrolase)